MELHQFSIENIFVEMESSPQGLSDEEVLKRLALHGPNVLAEKQKCSPLLLFISQFGDFMILVLLGAAVLAGIIGDPSDMLPIIAIVLINAAIGFVQEYRAERAIAALKRMAGQRADVLRGGHAQVISAENIVPGDLVLLEAGNVVPADLRLIETFQLRVAESSLTGESFPVEKQSLELSNASIPLAERYNMAYRGTVIASGRGMGIAVATGMATELGKIATMIQGGREPKTPLQKKLSAFGRRLAFGILVVCALVFCLGLLRGEPILLMFLTAISLAVAAIPEALPAVVTISLALGARRMVNRNALIRKLPAVETLGAVSYICTDKTGTLTQNRMTVTHLMVNDELLEVGLAQRTLPESFHELVEFGILASQRDPFDPMEKAFRRLGERYLAATEHMHEDWTLVREYPLSQELLAMSRVWKSRETEDYVIAAKGAPEAVADLCHLEERDLARLAREHGAACVVDEIYLGLSFEAGKLAHIEFTKDGKIRAGLEFLQEPPAILPPWKTAH